MDRNPQIDKDRINCAQRLKSRDCTRRSKENIIEADLVDGVALSAAATEELLTVLEVASGDGHCECLGSLTQAEVRMNRAWWLFWQRLRNTRIRRAADLKRSLLCPLLHASASMPQEWSCKNRESFICSLLHVRVHGTHHWPPFALLFPFFFAGSFALSPDALFVLFLI